MFKLLKRLLSGDEEKPPSVVQRRMGPKAILKTDYGRKTRTRLTQLQYDPVARGFKQRRRQSR